MATAGIASDREADPACLSVSLAACLRSRIDAIAADGRRRMHSVFPRPGASNVTVTHYGHRRTVTAAADMAPVPGRQRAGAMRGAVNEDGRMTPAP